KLRGVYNELFAEVFRQQTADQKSGLFERKCRRDDTTGFIPPAAKVVPAWASRIVMTVDTQKDHFWFVVRAWGAGFRSRRLHHGRVATFEELSVLMDESLWPYENSIYPPLRVHMT